MGEDHMRGRGGRGGMGDDHMRGRGGRGGMGEEHMRGRGGRGGMGDEHMRGRGGRGGGQNQDDLRGEARIQIRERTRGGPSKQYNDEN